MTGSTTTVGIEVRADGTQEAARDLAVVDASLNTRRNPAHGQAHLPASLVRRRVSRFQRVRFVRESQQFRRDRHLHLRGHHRHRRRGRGLRCRGAPSHETNQRNYGERQQPPFANAHQKFDALLPAFCGRLKARRIMRPRGPFLFPAFRGPPARLLQPHRRGPSLFPIPLGPNLRSASHSGPPAIRACRTNGRSNRLQREGPRR